MSPPEQLATFLHQWHELSRAESAAIQASAWPLLHEIQSRKTSLRQPMLEAYRQCQAGESGPAGAPASMRSQVARLLAMAGHNERLLTIRRDSTREKLAHLGRSARNLRNLRKSYVPIDPPRACNSYS